jgi:hypothetical protein
MAVFPMPELDLEKRLQHRSDFGATICRVQMIAGWVEIPA